jgi:hypothetical protein
MTTMEIGQGRSRLPNGVDQIAERVTKGTVRPSRVWGMLFLRPALALGMQLAFFAVFSLIGVADPWRQAADWWLVSLALGEFLNLWLLARCATGEGIRLRDLYNPGGRVTLGGDMKWLLLALIVVGPVAFLPNLLLGTWLWGDPQTSSDLIFRDIPVAAAWAAVIVFPVIHALTEAPTYFGYVMPRLQVLKGSRWAGLLIPGLALSAQHVFMPLLFDWRYLVWRLLMFLAFALWVAWVIDRRPTTLPYLVASHWLIDLSLPIFVLLAST